MEDGLVFKCSCGNSEKPMIKVLNGFSGISYENMAEWTDFNETNLPDLSFGQCPRSNTIPKENTYKIIKVRFPFNFNANDSFHLLFVPANSYFNGWDDSPDEINDSGVIMCQFVKILSRNEKQAFITVKILEVTTLPQLLQLPSQIIDIDYVQEIKNNKYYYIFSYNDWTLHGWNAQSDIGGYALVHHEPNGLENMILYNEWSFHYNNTWYGNIKVSTN